VSKLASFLRVRHLTESPLWNLRSLCLDREFPNSSVQPSTGWGSLACCEQ